MSARLLPASISPPFTLPINIGVTASNSLAFEKFASDAEAIAIAAPNVISDANTLTIEMSLDNEVSYQTLVDLTDTPVKVPGAGHVMVYNGVITCCTHFRIRSSGTITVPTIFQIYKVSRA